MTWVPVRYINKKFITLKQCYNHLVFEIDYQNIIKIKIP